MVANSISTRRCNGNADSPSACWKLSNISTRFRTSGFERKANRTRRCGRQLLIVTWYFCNQGLIHMGKGKPELLDRELGQKIAGARNAIPMSQEELAHRLNISAAQLGRYERGKSRWSVALYLRVCGILEIEPDLDRLRLNGRSLLNIGDGLGEVQDARHQHGFAEAQKMYVSGNGKRTAVEELTRSVDAIQAELDTARRALSRL